MRIMVGRYWWNMGWTKCFSYKILRDIEKSHTCKIKWWNACKKEWGDAGIMDGFKFAMKGREWESRSDQYRSMYSSHFHLSKKKGKTEIAIKQLKVGKTSGIGDITGGMLIYDVVEWML